MEIEFIDIGITDEGGGSFQLEGPEVEAIYESDGDVLLSATWDPETKTMTENWGKLRVIVEKAE